MSELASELAPTGVLRVGINMGNGLLVTGKTPSGDPQGVAPDMAAERTGRRCYGLELDPAYVDTIVRRWQALIGGSALHAASGRSFDDLAREAEATNAA